MTERLEKTTDHAGDGTPFLYIIYCIYFVCGLTQCFEGVFLPEFKEYFSLNYQHQMYIVFAKNIPFIITIPVGMAVVRIGYRNCLAVAMLFYAMGMMLLVLGLRAQQYRIVLTGFLIVGAGFSMQMVAGNPLIIASGSPAMASSRLNLANALGAIAQILAPASVAFLIPAAAVSTVSKLPYINRMFFGLGVVLFITAIVTFLTREGDSGRRLQQPQQVDSSKEKSIWMHPRVIVGAMIIFLLLGAEAGLFSFFRNYVEDPAIAGLSSHRSEQLFTLYFALFALGRLTASKVQKKMSPVTHLIWHLLAAIGCGLVAVWAKGIYAVVAATALAFFVSIFFPTVYAIAIEGTGRRIGQASGLLTLGFLGGAFLPVLQGSLADGIGLQRSYLLPLVIYLIVLTYSLVAAYGTPHRAEC